MTHTVQLHVLTSCQPISQQWELIYFSHCLQTDNNHTLVLSREDSLVFLINCSLSFLGKRRNMLCLAIIQ